ncbi:unnamed protein product [Acidithrix sp. C25]|nr:unnamed protein product [Acidithrix sp. C25]
MGLATFASVNRFLIDSDFAMGSFDHTALRIFLKGNGVIYRPQRTSSPQRS